MVSNRNICQMMEKGNVRKVVNGQWWFYLHQCTHMSLITKRKRWHGIWFCIDLEAIRKQRRQGKNREGSKLHDGNSWQEAEKLCDGSFNKMIFLIRESMTSKMPILKSTSEVECLYLWEMKFLLWSYVSLSASLLLVEYSVSTANPPLLDKIEDWVLIAICRHFQNSDILIDY